MAIYQYYLAVVPKQGIEKRHDFIPNEIGVNTKTGFFESDANLYWKEVEKQADNIISKIDLIISRDEWGNDKTNYNWKIYTEHIDHDASIHLNEVTRTIREFYFRADLREENLIFLNSMIALGREMNGCLWIGRAN